MERFGQNDNIPLERRRVDAYQAITQFRDTVVAQGPNNNPPKAKVLYEIKLILDDLYHDRESQTAPGEALKKTRELAKRNALQCDV